MALHDPPLEIPFINTETGFVTEPWAKWLIITKRDKANRVEDGTEDNIATLDEDGHPQDSGIVLPIGSLIDWVAGTSNRITVTDDGDGTITITIPDSPQLVGLLLSGLSASRLLGTDVSKNLESKDIANWISGTAAQITVTDDGDGTVTISVPAPFRIPATGNNYISILADGDAVFYGTAGLPYGSLYLHEGAANVDISTAGQGVYVKITGFTTGLLNNVTINSDAFNVGYAGTYKVDWSISGDSQGNNKIYEVDIFVNGVEQHDGSARTEFGALGSLAVMSGTGIIDVTDTSHDIDLRMKEPGAGAGTDFDIFHMNFNILQIGGT